MTKVFGETDKISKYNLAELDSLYDFKAEGRDLVPQELADRLFAVTRNTGREVSAYLNRRGRVVSISVGDADTAPLPALTERRGEAADGRLSGLRCIHTHPSGSSLPSSVDVASTKSLKLDAMIVLAESALSVTLLERDPNTNELNSSVTFGPYRNVGDVPTSLWDEIHYVDKGTKSGAGEENAFVPREEKCVLVGLDRGMNLEGSAQELIDELAELAETAGLQVVHKMTQKRSRPEAATYIGKGFAQELTLIAQSLEAEVIVLDDELSGAQIRNLENMTGKKVIDRTTLILDIFAQRARTGEGKAQVELAQLKYRLPRLMGLGKVLSRLGGGIGTRGPGEKKLETDRRHLRRRITFLEQELKALEKRRALNRETRSKNSIPVIAIVGYTNAGKSTLINALCGSDIYAEDKLFATLDPTTRSLELEDGQEVLFTDTVGFIRKLPHDLIEAFKSTLEEAVHCDLLIHVADLSSPEVINQINVVHSLLSGLNALDKTEILALNKFDILQGAHCDAPNIQNPFGPVVEISAKSGFGVDALLSKVIAARPRKLQRVTLAIPFSDGAIQSYVHRHGKIISEAFTDSGYEIVADMPFDKHSAIIPFIK
ncbi:MAG: GTPase HflX [Bacillota bacterium]